MASPQLAENVVLLADAQAASAPAEREFPPLAPAELAETAEPSEISEALALRAVRLAIVIGARVARLRDDGERDAIFAEARETFIRDLLARGQSPAIAAEIAEDIIGGARKLAQIAASAALVPG